MQFIRIRQWAEYQHYKKRDPPWVKLHKTVLQSRTWIRANGEDRQLFMVLLLLAAKHNNMIPHDLHYVKRVGSLRVLPKLRFMLESQFIEIVEESRENASAMLAPLGREQRQSTEAEQQQEAAALKNGGRKMPSKEASRIAERVASLLEGDPESKNWHGSYVETWLVEGHTEEQIVAAAERVSSRGTEVHSITYLQAILKEEFAAPEESTVGVLPPPGMRASKSTGEYLEWGRQTYGPKFDHGHIKYSKWQFVPADWNVTQLRKVSA